MRPSKPLRVEAHRIGHAQHDPLAVLQREDAVVEVARGHRHVLAEAEGIVLIDPRVVARLGAVLADAFEARTRDTDRTPSPQGNDRRWPSARSADPCTCGDRSCRYGRWRATPTPRPSCRCRRRARRSRASERCRPRPAPSPAGSTQARAARLRRGCRDRPPHRTVIRVRHHRVEPGVHALVLGRIDGGRRARRIVVAAAVAVGVEDQRRPALRLRRITSLQEHLRVHPAHHGAAAARPQRIVGVETKLRVVRVEAGVDELVLLGLRIPAPIHAASTGSPGTASPTGDSSPTCRTAGCRDPCTAAAIHTRPALSSIELWLLTF